jgi:hypothetical protein
MLASVAGHPAPREMHLSYRLPTFRFGIPSIPPAEGALPMKSVRLSWIAILLVLRVPAFVLADETERVHKVVPLGPGGTVVLHNFSGQVRIVDAGVSEVTVDAVRTGSRDRLDRIKLDVQSWGSTVTIEANKTATGTSGTTTS